ALRVKLLAVGLVVVVTVTGWAAAGAYPGPRPDAAGSAVRDPAPAPLAAPAADPAAARRERLAGLWQVESGTRDGRPLTDWERQGFRVGFDPAGVFTIHRGQLHEQRTFTWAVDRAAPAPTLVLTPTDGNPAGVIRVPF